VGVYRDYARRRSSCSGAAVDPKDTEYLKLCERCYGFTWSETEECMVRGQGALDGSIDKWIEILQQVANSKLDAGRFLDTLRLYLGTESNVPPEMGIDLASLTRAWARTCEVPPSVRLEVVPIREAILAVNSFRNRFAHVPFPYDQLQDVARELETCTVRLFEIQSATAGEESSLCGSFALGDYLLRGAGFHKTPDAWKGIDHEGYVWGKSSNSVIWDARPFILLDKMMRPYLLTRLKNEAGWWEYTRYLAEANAVASVTNADFLKLLRRPTEEDYTQAKAEEVSVAQTPQPAKEPERVIVTSRDQAFAAMREGQFEPAVSYLKSIVDEKPSFHSGWQRLGLAQREWAVRLMDSNEASAQELLRESLNSFNHAVGHTDLQYSAEAFYNRSKTHWRLWQITRNPNELRDCLRDAEEAAKRYFEERFLSWVDFVRENATGIAGAATEEVD
jgi:tetratricopeptide (TPR) repeat protein